MVLSYTNEVNQDFKLRMVWWYAKLNNIKLKIWQDPWLDFMLCWMIFDAYLTEISKSGVDKQKLKYFYQNKNDFKERIMAKWVSLSGYASRLKELSPVHDMRPGSSKTVQIQDVNNLEEVFNFVYQIRCNLFHGAKNVKNAKDTELVSRGAKFLRTAIDCWMKMDKF